MKKMSVFRIASFALSFLLMAVVALAADAPTAAVPPSKPEPAYLSMKFQKLDGSGEATIKSLLKKDNTLLVFFQSACINCLSELKALKEAYTDSPKIDVVGIGVDVRPEQLKKFVEELGFPKVTLLDQKWDLGPKVLVSFTPAVVMLDKTGAFHEVLQGFTPETIGKINSKLK